MVRRKRFCYVRFVLEGHHRGVFCLGLNVVNALRGRIAGGLIMTQQNAAKGSLLLYAYCIAYTSTTGGIFDRL